ncbi:MAG: undecaprenyl/decaprenyl-phosphate alpha-N-acetylglucosaminyl 1-phosphate transferase [Deltaproteobacteria bacterium]|nr:undecaprenyl/decaprenyl-phosphate alpha-N-acetylglucosaminyl 1-phosphate transferase [Deltaproteobacteria bacterium]
MMLDQTRYLYLALFGGGLLISLLLTPLVRKLALFTGQVAVPKDNRWHKKATPLLGGVGIFCSTTAMWLIASARTEWNILEGQYLPLLLCGSAIFVLGLADDIFNMDPQHKLAGQIIIVSVLMFFGFRLEWTTSKTINLFLTILWVVGITNAFNLLDNMDGLATGIAFIAGGFLFAFLYLNPGFNHLTTPVMLMTAGYLGALLGFLVFNFNPASIFMGDGGSLFIGFVLACLTVLGSPEHSMGASSVRLLSVIAIPVRLHPDPGYYLCQFDAKIVQQAHIPGRKGPFFPPDGRHRPFRNEGGLGTVYIFCPVRADCIADQQAEHGSGPCSHHPVFAFYHFLLDIPGESEGLSRGAPVDHRKGGGHHPYPR